MTNTFGAIVLVICTIFIEVGEKFFRERYDYPSHNVYHGIGLNHTLSSFMEEACEDLQEEDVHLV